MGWKFAYYKELQLKLKGRHCCSYHCRHLLKMIVLGPEKCGKTNLIASFSKALNGGTNITAKLASRMEAMILHDLARERVQRPLSNDKNFTLRFTTATGHFTTMDIVETNVLKPIVDPLADIYVLTFDITDPSSLQSVVQWFKTAKPSVPSMLVGCKSDLRYKGDVPFSRKEAEAIAKQLELKYAECSSQDPSRALVRFIFYAAVDLTISSQPNYLL